MSAVLTKECNVVANSEELISTTEYLTLWARCRINRCRYNRVRLYLVHLMTSTHFRCKSQLSVRFAVYAGHSLP